MVPKRVPINTNVLKPCFEFEKPASFADIAPLFEGNECNVVAC